MSLGKPASVGFLLLLAVAGSGCTLLDRESYSLTFRKKAHLYQPSAPRENAPPDVSGVPMADSEPEADVELPPVLQPFRPFAYCLRHRSSHILESILAVGVSPVEYPVALVLGGPGAVIATGNIILGERPGHAGKDPGIEVDPLPPPAK